MYMKKFMGVALAALCFGVLVFAAGTFIDLASAASFALEPGHFFSAGMAVAPMSTRRPIAINSRGRGLIGVRADARNADVILAELQKTVADFMTENDKALADLRKGQADVVQTEKVERINSEITALQSSIDDVNQLVAGLRAGGSGSDIKDPAKAEYETAFNKYFRYGGDEDEIKALAVKASMSAGSNPDGGVTVPDEMETQIDRVLSTVSAMRRLARVLSISSGVYKKPFNLGGATYGWVGEGESRPQTDASQLAELSFPAMELYAMPPATRILLDDSSIDIAQWLADEVNTAFAEAEGAAFISGSGVNRPRGILSYDTVADANWSWGKLGFLVSGVAADIVDGTNNGVDALTNLVYALKQGYRQNASWLMNRTLQGAVRKLKDENGNYLWQPSIQLGQPATLLGYPVADDDNMSDVGANALPIAFGDFQRGYLIVDRRGIEILRDPFTAKPYVLFYTTKRVGGGVSNYEAIKFLKCST